MRLTRILFQDIRNLIQRYSRYQQSCLSIEQYTSFGKCKKIFWCILLLKILHILRCFVFAADELRGCDQLYFITESI